MPVKRRPWDLQPQETKRSYEVFREYLALGPKRSLAQLAQKMGLNTSTQYKRWSSRYNWQARAREYDVVQHIELDDVSDKRREVIAIVLDAAPELARNLIEIAVDTENSAATRIKATDRCLSMLGLEAPQRLEVSGPDKRPLTLEHAQKILEQLPPNALTTLRDVLASVKPPNGETSVD